MKNFFVSPVIFLLALIIGCQENLINEPENNSAFKKDNISDLKFIKICCEIRDPGFGVCNLNGCVAYSHKITDRSMNPVGLAEILLHLEMDSKLCDKFGMTHLEWRIQGRSDDIVYVSEEGILLLEKTYPITNRDDVVLLVRYMVTTNGVGISSMMLAQIER
jgi:hypothetical protein